MYLIKETFSERRYFFNFPLNCVKQEGRKEVSGKEDFSGEFFFAIF